ncbi:MAG: hypothetical protein ACOCXQ_04610 [Patescibacteria group bacterium]
MQDLNITDPNVFLSQLQGGEKMFHPKEFHQLMSVFLEAIDGRPDEMYLWDEITRLIEDPRIAARGIQNHGSLADRWNWNQQVRGLGLPAELGVGLSPGDIEEVRRGLVRASGGTLLLRLHLEGESNLGVSATRAWYGNQAAEEEIDPHSEVWKIASQLESWGVSVWNARAMENSWLEVLMGDQVLVVLRMYPHLYDHNLPEDWPADAPRHGWSADGGQTPWYWRQLQGEEE